MTGCGWGRRAHNAQPLCSHKQGLTTMMHSAGATKAQTAPLVMDSQQLWMEAKREVHTTVPLSRTVAKLVSFSTTWPI